MRLFGQAYTDCERERQILEQEIEEFCREYGGRNGFRFRKALRIRERQEGEEKNRPEVQEQIKALWEQGKSIRKISAETGIPKSTVQKLKKDV